ncbi:Outer membrane efflux protein [Cohaesibacter sp. ES.047]|uniref:TolC family protein n=1 Tax=Cohaesibacter sp. ES.047 TaxID=1798205 RepID=UPI000BB67DB4|nr:TolC family protein [Cohaesibacter sp. ES.047]SNY90137.1 Outer membrane efflux protein [Cohaesibacter sp. ES.047]
MKLIHSNTGSELCFSATATGISRGVRTCLVLAAIIAPLLGAATARADNLAQMLYDVYDNNPDIRAQEAALEASRASTRKAASAYAPKINATAGHSMVEERLKAGGRTRTRTTQYGLSASHRLFNGFQNRNNLISSKYTERSSLYQVRNKERQILLEAVKAYMDVFAARKMINLRRRYLTNLLDQQRGTKARIRAGELTRTDLSKTDALIYRARASLEGASADLGAAVGRYESLVGYKPAELIFPQMPVSHLPQTVEEAERKALQMHPDLRASRASVKASEYAVKSAQGAFLPTLDVSGEVNRNYASSHAETNKAEGAFSLRLSLPIFDGGARMADVQKARALRDQQKYASHALSARIKADAREQFLRNRAAQVALKQASAEVRAVRDLLRGIKIEEKAGQRSFLDILDAEVSLLDAQELEIYSKADSVIAIYSFLAATGQLTVSGARKAQLQYAPEAVAAIARAEQMNRPKSQKVKTTGPRKSDDPWSGLR